MNEVTSVLNTLSLLAAGGAILVLVLRGRHVSSRGSRVTLELFLALFLFHEWTGLTETLEAYGDYLRILMPLIWAAFVYTMLQEGGDRELRASKERFRSLVETTSDWVWESTPDGRYTYSNPRVREILGYGPQEVVGRRSVDFMTSEEAEQAVKAVSEAIRKGMALENVTHTMVNGDGRRVFIETAAVPFFDSRGEVIGFRGVSRDVTGRKEAEEALRLSKENLELQNRELLKIDKIKDGLIRDVSHELKTPVAKLSMQIELLSQVLRSLEIREITDPIIKVMKDSLRRQERVIMHILDVSRLEEGGRKYNVRACELHAVLSEVVEDFRFDAEANGVTIRTKLEPLTIDSDEEMLWHVFSNLLGNAIKFSKGSDRPTVDVLLEATNGRPRVTVADNGVGLEKDEMERVFNRFYKAVPSTEGAGVGLNIAKMIVEDLGGDIRLESPGRGRGTTVLVRL